MYIRNSFAQLTPPHLNLHISLKQASPGFGGEYNPRALSRRNFVSATAICFLRIALAQSCPHFADYGEHDRVLDVPTNKKCLASGPNYPQGSPRHSLLFFFSWSLSQDRRGCIGLLLTTLHGTTPSRAYGGLNPGYRILTFPLVSLVESSRTTAEA